MRDIKQRNISNKNIKVLDKSLNLSSKLKENIVSTKKKINNINNKEEGTYEFSSNKVSFVSNRIKEKAIKTLLDVNKPKIKIRINSFVNNPKENKKFKTIGKKMGFSSNSILKKQKNSYKIKKLTSKSLKSTVRTIKVTGKVITSSVKAIILATKSLVSLIAAGGWIAVLIIIIIGAIAIILASVFGIFFSNEDVNENSVSMTSLISELNIELETKINNIRKNYPNFEIKVNDKRADWKNILAVYSVKASDNQSREIVTLDKEKIKILEAVFWDMNKISYEIVNKTLIINIQGESINNIKKKYNFNSEQENQLNELLNPEFNSLWDTIIYDTPVVGNGKWAWPTIANYKITDEYGYGIRDDIGETVSRLHAGVDIGGLGCNTPIFSANSGKVILAGNSGSFGNAVKVNHENNYITLYAHLNKILVKNGEVVKKGQQIGLMGNTGYSFGCHLHFQVEYKGKTINPLTLY